MASTDTDSTQNKKIVKKTDPRDSRQIMTPAQKKPVTPTVAQGKGNQGHVMRSAVKSAVDTWMKSGMSSKDAVDKIRQHLGPDFMNAGTAYGEGHRVWPAVVDQAQNYGYVDDGYYRRGGGGGGGGLPTPPPVKIRTSSGIRRSPYWESEDPFINGFEPRFVVLGDQNAW